MLSKGPKYRESKSINWKYNFIILMDSVEDYAGQWIKYKKELLQEMISASQLWTFDFYVLHFSSACKRSIPYSGLFSRGVNFLFFRGLNKIANETTLYKRPNDTALTAIGHRTSFNNEQINCYHRDMARLFVILIIQMLKSK